MTLNAMLGIALCPYHGESVGSLLEASKWPCTQAMGVQLSINDYGTGY